MTGQGDVIQLLATGKTDLLQFVSSRTRRPFAAFLVRQGDGKIGFEFEAKTGARGRGAKATRGSTVQINVSKGSGQAFLDAMTFWDKDHGIVFGDSVDFEEGHVTMSSPIGRALVARFHKAGRQRVPAALHHAPVESLQRSRAGRE